MRAAALLALLSMTAAAKDSPMTWKTEKNELFEARVPELWRRKPLSGPEAGYLFTDGARFISVSKPAKDLEEFAARAKTESPEIETTTVTVLGKKARKLTQVARANAGGDEGPGPSEWTYEETVLVPEKGGFWRLEFRSNSAGPKPSPKALATWDKFLKSFKPSVK